MDRRGRGPLHRAVLNDDGPMVRSLVEQGVDFSLVDDYGFSAVHLALLLGKEACLHSLGKGLCDQACLLQMRDEKELRWVASKELGRLLNFSYTPSLLFQSERDLLRLAAQSHKGLLGHYLDKEQEWLGIWHRKDILSTKVEKCSIRWVSPEIGYGLFAERTFPAQQYLGVYGGEVKRVSWIWPGRSDYKFRYPTRAWSWIPYTIDAEKKGNVLRFLNHSEKGNVEMIGVYCEPLMYVIARTCREVKKGEELRYDYGPYYWRNRPKPI